ncbi:MAG: transporter substrate-binding domain-containing protein [Natronospirillum sp.]
MRYLLLVAILVAIPVSAEPLRVFGYDLDYRLTPSGGGHYNELIRVLQGKGLDIELTILPLVRSLRSMEDSESACNFPATINAVIRSYPEFSTIPLVSGDPIDQISLRVLTRKGDPLIENLEELSGRRVALWGGLQPEAFLGDVDAIIEHTPNESVRLRMLEARRLDVIIGFVPDVMLVAEAQNLPLPHFAENLALYRDEGASIVCRDTPKNRQTLKHFNQLMGDLKASGELRRILGPHAEIVD